MGRESPETSVNMGYEMRDEWDEHRHKSVTGEKGVLWVMSKRTRE